MQQKADQLRSIFSDFGQFHQAYSPLVQSVYGLDEQRAYMCAAPMLCTMDAAYFDGASLQWLAYHIGDMNHKIGVKVKMDEMQIADLARSIRNEFGFLKTSEVMRFFYRLKDGHYGEFFGIIDKQRIMRALRGKFLDERANWLSRHENEAKERERERWAREAATPEQIEEIMSKFK